MSNHPPKFIWKRFPGYTNLKARYHLWISVKEVVGGKLYSVESQTRYFVDAHRYADQKTNGRPATLYGSGMHMQGCALQLKHGTISELKTAAESRALADLETRAAA